MRVALVLGILVALAAFAGVATADSPPEITNPTPEGFGVELAVSEERTFSISVSDPDTPRANLTVEWYVNDRLVERGGTEFVYDADAYGPGANTVLVVVSDGDSMTGDARRTWNVDVFAPPEIERYEPGRESLDLGQADAIDFFVSVDDPDSDITASDIVWTVDGRQVATGEAYIFETTEFASGRHTVEVTVSDETEITADASRSWTIRILEPPNIHSVRPADPGPIAENQNLTFSVDADDPDTPDDELIYRWYVGSELVERETAASEFTFRAREFGPGDHTVRVGISDQTGPTGIVEHEWSISVLPLPEISIVQPEPSAADPDVLSVFPGRPVEFVAEASAPGEGEIESIDWQIGSDTYRDQGRRLTVTVDEVEDRDVSATVRTTAGFSQTTTKRLRVLTAPPLITALEPGSIEIRSGERITLYANATDRYGRSLTYDYTWSWSGEEYDGQTTTIGPLRRVGRHTIQATVTNEYGASVNESFGVFVQNTPPRVSIENARRSVDSGETIRFPARVLDNDTSSVAVQYYADNETEPFDDEVLDDTSGGVTVEASRAFDEPGTHTVTVRAADGHGAVTERQWRVAVDNRPPQITDATPQRAQRDVLSGTRQTFSARATDPENTTIDYQWYYDGSAAGSGPEYATTVNTSGSHNVTVVASDADGGRDRRTWQLDASSFRTEPTITDQSTATEIGFDVNSSTLLTLTFQNPEANSRTARVEFVLKPINGVTYRGLQNVREASPSSVISYSDVAPGFQEQISIRIDVDESLRGKRLDIPYTIRYYPTVNARDTTTVRNGSITVEVGLGGDGGSSNPGAVGDGFGVVAVVLAVLVVAGRYGWPGRE